MSSIATVAKTVKGNADLYRLYERWRRVAGRTCGSLGVYNAEQITLAGFAIIASGFGAALGTSEGIGYYMAATAPRQLYLPEWRDPVAVSALHLGLVASGLTAEGIDDLQVMMEQSTFVSMPSTRIEIAKRLLMTTRVKRDGRPVDMRAAMSPHGAVNRAMADPDKWPIWMPEALEEQDAEKRRERAEAEARWQQERKAQQERVDRARLAAELDELDALLDVTTGQW